MPDRGRGGGRPGRARGPPRRPRGPGEPASSRSSHRYGHLTLNSGGAGEADPGCVDGPRLHAGASFRTREGPPRQSLAPTSKCAVSPPPLEPPEQTRGRARASGPRPGIAGITAAVAGIAGITGMIPAIPGDHWDESSDSRDPSDPSDVKSPGFPDDSVHASPGHTPGHTRPRPRLKSPAAALSPAVSRISHRSRRAQQTSPLIRPTTSPRLSKRRTTSGPQGESALTPVAYGFRRYVCIG